MKSPTKINSDIKIGKINYQEEEKRKYYCTCCGKPYSKQDGNFSKSVSPLYAGNNGYVHICKDCVNKHFITITDFFTGNEEKAIDRFCQIFDWYYDIDAVAASRKITANRTRINVYPSKMNLTQSSNRGNTYLDTIKDRVSNTINSIEEFEELKQQDSISVSDRTLKRWGLGFSDSELTELDRHYKMLKDLQISSDDVVQDIQIRSACEQHIMKLRTRETDPDKYIKFTESYNKTLEKAGLKSKANIRDGLNDGAVIVGKWIDDIENFCPAEYYADKNKYYDFFNIKDYIERFLYRPLKNLLLGTKDRDAEFNIDVNNNES